MISHFRFSGYRGSSKRNVAGNTAAQGKCGDCAIQNRGTREKSINEFSIFFLFTTQCYMYCLWEQFGLVDDKRDLSLNGMLTFFHRIPAYRAEVQKAISKCKGIGKYFGIYRVFDILIF